VSNARTTILVGVWILIAIAAALLLSVFWDIYTLDI
jgi:hypothetical protein